MEEPGKPATRRMIVWPPKRNEQKINLWQFGPPSPTYPQHQGSPFGFSSGPC